MELLINPFEIVIDVGNIMYPNIKAIIQFNPDIKECGCTTFPDDNTTPIIDISTNIPFDAMIETLAHEIAHLVAGIEHGHDEVWEKVFADIHENYGKLLNENFESKVKHSDEVYYEIMTTGSSDKQGPVYVWIIEGDHMLQSSIYDATKFTTRELAEKRIEIIKNIFTDRDFNIVKIDKRIFGDTPRNVMNYEAGYISNAELNSYAKFTDNQKKTIKSMYAKYPKGFFKNPRCALY